MNPVSLICLLAAVSVATFLATILCCVSKNSTLREELRVARQGVDVWRIRALAAESRARELERQVNELGALKLASLAPLREAGRAIRVKHHGAPESAAGLAVNEARIGRSCRGGLTHGR